MIRSNRAAVLASLVLSLLSAGTVAQAEEGALAHREAKPRLPGNPGFWYPERAMRLNIDGVGVIECSVVAGGKLEECEAVSETPPGSNFQDAALALARKGMRAEPIPADARFQAGERVRLTVHFAWPRVW